MNLKLVSDIIKKEGTPFYFFEPERFEKNITSFKDALLSYYDKIIIGYSFKTNYSPYICSLAKSLNCYAEVVSNVELLLAEKLEFTKNQIIFNGPYKTIDDIEKAVKLGSIINFDNYEQLELLSKINTNLISEVKLGLRININLDENNINEKKAKGAILARFGFEENMIPEAIKKVQNLKLKIVSLHGHCSSSDRKPSNYKKIISALLHTQKHYNLKDIKYLNVGGGFSGRVPTIWEAKDSPSFSDYAKAIFECANENEWFKVARPWLVIEPGMSVVADTMTLVTSVVSKKLVQDETILGVDANFYNVRPTFHKKPLTYHYFKSDLSLSNEQEIKIRAVVGNTCMERDILLENIKSPIPNLGDIIMIEDTGAYCSVLTPSFISYTPAIFALENEKYSVIKNKQNFDSYFIDYKFTTN